MNDDWTVAPLGDLVTIKTGKLDVNQGSENGTYPFFTCSKHVYRIDYPAFEGPSIIVAGNGDLNVRYYDGEFNAYQRTYVLQAKCLEGCDLKFLHLFLDGYVSTLRENSSGSVIKYIKLPDLRDARVPLPPLPVQRRIVDLMAHLDNQIANLRLERDAARAVRVATLSNLLDATREIPADYDAAFDLAASAPQASPTSEQAMNDDWVETTLGEVASWGAGGTPKAGDPRYYEGGSIPWAVIADVQDGPLRVTEKCITAAGARVIGHLAPANAVLVTMYGTIGRVAITQCEMATNQAIAWGVADEGLVTPEFLFHWLRNFRPTLDSLARGATQRNINRAILKGSPISLPPLPVQRRIVDLMAHLDNQIAGVDVEVSTLESLRRQLLASLLSQGVELPASYDLLLDGVA